MRAFSALPLDDDIMDHIMAFCPTFGTLHAMLLVSKAFYRVYQTHSKSLTLAVAYNVVGPALPQALRVIRYPYGAPDGGDRLKDDPEEMATECPEGDSLGMIMPEEKEQLQENAKVISALEAIYSLTQKDRTSRTSVLTSHESWRFRRAAYRIMFYCNLFSATYDELDDTMGCGMSDGEIWHVHSQRTAVLMQYQTEELLQLYAVVRFFRGILEDVTVWDANQSARVDILLALGPSGVKCAWDERSKKGTHSSQTTSRSPLDNIWRTRQVTPPKDHESAMKWILDEVRGVGDTCSRCAAPGGLALFTANWHRIPEFEPVWFLKGRLKNNSWVTPLFLGAVGRLSVSAEGEEDFGLWIASVFDAASASTKMARGGDSSTSATRASTSTSELASQKATTSTNTMQESDCWDRDESYCRPCLTKFLKENTSQWLRDDMVRGGWTPPEDCWYGYNCRTMA
ncbi:hypothetical protein K438DRAFT_2032714 [Mycena galopus ATCC 62051]|nr:hypothetical protein K438DRAFT_2032714 [Mycena galopus ATCC 62051]